MAMAFSAPGTCYCYGSVRCNRHLITAEQKLRLLDPRGMYDGNILTIKFNAGFEAFSRGIPYHNYEDWGSGFVIESGRVNNPISGKPIFSSHEYLDAAIDGFLSQYRKTLVDEKEIERFDDRLESINRQATDWLRRGNGKSHGY